jgi:hypothetical protein
VPQSRRPSPTELLVDLIDSLSVVPAPRLEGVAAPLVLPVPLPPLPVEASDGGQGCLREPKAPSS